MVLRWAPSVLSSLFSGGGVARGCVQSFVSYLTESTAERAGEIRPLASFAVF